MLRRLVSAQILPFGIVGFFLALNQNTPKSSGTLLLRTIGVLGEAP